MKLSQEGTLAVTSLPEGEGAASCFTNERVFKKYSSFFFLTEVKLHGGSDSKEFACSAGDPWVGKISWRKEWQPTPVILPGETQGQRRLMDYSSWGCEELDMTE